MEKTEMLLTKTSAYLGSLTKGCHRYQLILGSLTKAPLFLNLPKDLQIQAVWWKIVK